VIGFFRMTIETRIPFTAAFELYRNNVERAIVVGAAGLIVYRAAEDTLAVNHPHLGKSDIIEPWR
jgi:hypothetical protein